MLDNPEIMALYQELIIDHGTHPRNHHALENCTHKAAGYNPLCGDKVELFVILDPVTHIIEKASFTGSGCAISMASASLLTESLVGKTVPESMEISKELNNILVHGKSEAGTMLPIKLLSITGVKEFPARIKCATLAWHAMEQALSNRN